VTDDVGGLLDAAPIGFISFADDGTVTAVNATLLRLLGHERDDVVGQHVERLMTIGTRIFYQTHLFPLVRMHGSAEEIFLVLQAAAGEHIAVLANLVRRGRDGVMANDCALMQVRERQKFEDELLRARRAAEAAHAELQQQKRGLERANALLADQAAELERSRQQLEDQAVELEAASDELQTANDELVARAAELEDLRVAADRANRAKSDFLAVMSHELRTPLNAIAGYAQLLEMGIHGPITDAQREALDRIMRGQRHLLRLVNDVLDLARIESGHVTFDLQDIAVADIVRAVKPLIEPQIELKRLALRVDVPESLAVRADREKGQQILLNLLSNAVKFTPEGGCISLAAVPGSDDRGVVHVHVQDTGLGIAPDQLDAVLEPFVRVGEADSHGSEGTGLGLSISRDLARGMHGDLDVRSVLGEGSTFTLTLPRAATGAS
jgi:signal transduction histidine kinase